MMECGFCLSKILNKKSYRKVNNEEFSCVLMTIGLEQSMIDIVCSNCFNRLNKLKIFDKGVKERIDKLKHDKEVLVQTLRDMPGIKRSSSITPTGSVISFNMDDNYTEMNDDDSPLEGQVKIKTEPIDFEYEKPGVSQPQVTEAQSRTVNENNNGVNSTQHVKSVERPDGERNIRNTVERLVKKNDQILAKHDAASSKPQSRTSTGLSISNTQNNIGNLKEPSDVCTLNDIPAHLSNLIGQKMASSSEEGFPADIIGAVGSKLSMVDTNSVKRVLTHVMYYWCNFCVFKSDNQEEILHHIMTHRFRCPNCSFQSYSRAAVMQHDLDKHGNVSDPSLKFYALLSDVFESKKTGKRKYPLEDNPEVIVKRERTDSETNSFETTTSDDNEDFNLKISDVRSGPEAVGNLVNRSSRSLTPLSPNQSNDQPAPSVVVVKIPETQTVADSIPTKPGPNSSSSLCWNCGYCSFVTMNQSFLKLHLNNAHAKMTHKYVALLATNADESAKIKASDEQFATSRIDLIAVAPASQTTTEIIVVNPKVEEPNPGKTKEDNPVKVESVNSTETGSDNKEEQKDDDEKQVKTDHLKKLPQTFKCAHCNFSSLKHDLIKNHLMKHHMGLVIYGLDMKAVRLKQKRYVLYCFKNECSFYTKEPGDYFEHLDECVPTIPNKSASMIKSIKSTRSFIEKTAKKSTPNSQYEKVADYSCDYCPYKGSNTWIKKHVLSHHPSKEKIIIRTNKGQSPSSVIYFCNDCLWETNSANDLEAHLKKHSYVTVDNKQEPSPKSQSPSSETVKPVGLSPTKLGMIVKKTTSSTPTVSKTPTVVLKPLSVKKKPGYYPPKKETTEKPEVHTANTDNSSNFDYSSHVSKTAYDSAVSRFMEKGNPSVRGSRPARNAALKCKAALKEMQFPPLYKCLYCSCFEFGPNLIKDHIMSNHEEKPLHAVNVMNEISDPAIKYALFCPEIMCEFVGHAPSVTLKHAKSVHSMSGVNPHLVRLMSIDQCHLNDSNAVSQQSSNSNSVSSISSLLPAEGSDAEGYQCFYCENSPVFSFRSSICKHFLEEHKTEDCRYHDCDLKIMGASSKYFMCQIGTCPFSTHEPDDYLLHMLGHQKVKVYECSLCRWFSITKKEVMDHQNVLHEKSSSLLEIDLDMDDDGCVIRRIGSTVIKSEKF